MTRACLIIVVALTLAACSSSHHERGHSWGIAVTEELKALLTDDAELWAGLYSTPETYTLIGGQGLKPEIEALLDAYRSTTDFKWQDFPQSKSFDGHDPESAAIVTYRSSRGTYLDLVVDKKKEGVRLLRLFKATARAQHAQVVVLREYDWERRSWDWVDEGLVANSAAIVKAWKGFEAGLQRETTQVDLPRWANRAPGSNRIPFTIIMPPYSYFPEIN